MNNLTSNQCILILQIAEKYYSEYIATIITLNSAIDPSKVNKHPIGTIEQFMENDRHYSFREDKHIDIQSLYKQIL